MLLMHICFLTLVAVPLAFCAIFNTFERNIDDDKPLSIYLNIQLLDYMLHLINTLLTNVLLIIHSQNINFASKSFFDSYTELI